MNILVTGASGFLGTAFLSQIKKERLLTDDNIILLTSKEINGYKCIMHKNYTFTKEDFISKGIDRIDLLLHMGAAVPRKSEEFASIFAYKFSENVVNTAWLINHIPSIPKKIVYISTVSIYKSDSIIRESTPILPSDMYGASKFLCEAYLKHLADEKGVILQILRLGQIYGEGEERYSKIVSSFVKQLVEGKTITVFGTGEEKRSMLYIEDCVRYIIAAMQFNDSQAPVNIAASEAISILDIIKLISRCCGKKEKILLEPDKPNRSIIYDTMRKSDLFHIDETDYETGISNYCKYYIKKYGG